MKIASMLLEDRPVGILDDACLFFFHRRVCLKTDMCEAVLG